MGLLGFLKNRPKKKWILADVSFDNDIWPDKSDLKTFMSDFGDENDEYDMTKQELIDEDIYHKVYEYTFDNHPIEVKEDGTVYLPQGTYSDPEMILVGRIHDKEALEIVRSGTVTKYVPFITGGPYKEINMSGGLDKGSDHINFRVYIHYIQTQK